MSSKNTFKQSSHIINIIMAIITLVTIYPFWHVVMYSISDSVKAMDGGLFIIPRGFSLANYAAMLKNNSIYLAYWNSILVTVVGTIINIILTATLAYPLSIKRFKGRNAISMMVFFTMLFSGGMIPTYILIDELNLLDSMWALILPTAISAWNLFIMKNFFQSIPPSLEESASLDGATPLRILVTIILPVSMPIIATMAVFYGVVHWNSYFNVILYINSQSKQTLPVFLRILLNSTAMDQVSSSNSATDVTAISQEGIKMAVIVAAVLPILVVYPFIQKYYVKGIMVGSVKG